MSSVGAVGRLLPARLHRLLMLSMCTVGMMTRVDRRGPSSLRCKNSNILMQLFGASRFVVLTILLMVMVRVCLPSWTTCVNVLFVLKSLLSS